ncbi:hypothetical protein EKO27_g3321 [Xylaria grammica]|uniref:Uncharacterized protein n=1 Tax=Xylaria grammica TaxID=363999 RepID=A0A439DBP8_9PEZI|nr:hypothetical protein EKO27_g3321 [Xylaria grammica]
MVPSSLAFAAFEQNTAAPFANINVGFQQVIDILRRRPQDVHESTQTRLIKLIDAAKDSHSEIVNILGSIINHRARLTLRLTLWYIIHGGAQRGVHHNAEVWDYEADTSEAVKGIPRDVTGAMNKLRLLFEAKEEQPHRKENMRE